MKTLMLSLLLALVGCSSVGSRSYEKEMDARFDLAAVTTFLHNLVNQHQTVEGVSLASTKVGDDWVVDETWMPVGLTAGDWTFQRDLFDAEKFTLSFRVTPQQAVSFHCRRQQKGVFAVLSFGKEDLVAVTNGRLKQ